MKKSLIYLFIVLVVIATSCLEPFEINSEDVQSKIVIEALLTDQVQNHYVKISRTIDFNQGGKTPSIDNATVKVTVDDGSIINYFHNPGQDADSSGYYLSEIAFGGLIGNRYNLEVDFEGVVYSASDEMLPVMAIDSLLYQLELDTDNGTSVDYYEVLMYSREPQETEDFYLFEFFQNGVLLNEGNEDVFVADDQVLAEEINGLEFPFEYVLGDTAKINIYSLSREAYVFYADLVNVLQNDGGMFSPPAANPRTNLSNGALGLFQVSAVVSDELIIE